MAVAFQGICIIMLTMKFFSGLGDLNNHLSNFGMYSGGTIGGKTKFSY